jgi:hypothetical protein
MSCIQAFLVDQTVMQHFKAMFILAAIPLPLAELTSCHFAAALGIED